MTDLEFKLPLKFSKETVEPDGRLFSCAEIEKGNQDFWAVWNIKKSEMKKAGFSVTKTGFKWFCHRYRDDNTIIEKSLALSSNAKIRSPEGLNYYPYQKAGITFAIERLGTLIADEMGLGKTIQAIGVINAVDLKTVLIIVPASVKILWQKECKKWLVDERNIKLIKNGKDNFPDNPDIVIINYDLIDKFKTEINSRFWDLVIMDECHKVKNPKAKRTKVALGIKAIKKIALTGTPIPNKPIELQPVAGYLNKESFGDYFRFAHRYCAAHRVDIGYGKTVWDFSGSSNLTELQNRLRQAIMIRRKKKDVLTELPDKIRQVIVLENGEFGEQLEKEFDALSDAVDNTSSNNEIIFEKMSGVRHQMALQKVDHVIKHLSDIDCPVVVFAHHKDVVDGIKQGLETIGKKVVILTGDMNIKNREKSIELFQAGKADVFIGTIGAAGVGITLTKASHVVFAEMDWVPANMNQAEDRCHRIGQEESVLVQHIVVDGSIDAKIAEVLVKKQGIIDKGIDNPELINVTVDEIPYNSVEIKKLYKDKKLKEIPADIVLAMQKCVRYLSDNCDGAIELDNAGFNKFDTPFGSSIAMIDDWTLPIQYGAKKMLKKYKRQFELTELESAFAKIYS